MARREPTLFDVVKERGVEAGRAAYLTPTPNTSDPPQGQQGESLDVVLAQAAGLRAEIRSLTEEIRARRPSPEADDA